MENKRDFPSRHLRSSQLAEEQAIAIYEAECAILARTGWSAARRQTLSVCRRILREERGHAGMLAKLPDLAPHPAIWRGVNRLAGRALGISLALLPSRISWAVHAWAEAQAAEIYRTTREGQVDRALIEALDHAAAQESEHSECFRRLGSQVPAQGKIFSRLNGMKFLVILGFTSRVATFAAGSPAPTLYDIPLTTLDGRPSSLSSYQGKVLLIVNTASQCGYTPQYEGLEKLFKEWKERGVVVLGFPSNDFGGQEPGSNQEIKSFCEVKFHVDFPMVAKGSVKGNDRQPLYSALLKASSDHSEIEWNFEKFVVDPAGKVVARFRSDTTPESAELIQALEKALKNH